MKILAIDFGEKRIGLAYGDTEIGIAFPSSILDAPPDPSELFLKIFEWTEEESIGKIIVGHPGSLSGAGSDQTQKVRQFADDLEDYFLSKDSVIPVEFCDESYSTKTAERQLQDQGLSSAEQKGKKDDLAAAAFLQVYLDKNSGE